uniref:Uncharacterized protein n=1 Tax=Meloidogyne floridensis TaxID=298350 RepID=A0A915ND02_9BILA
RIQYFRQLSKQGHDAKRNKKEVGVEKAKKAVEGRNLRSEAAKRPSSPQPTTKEAETQTEIQTRTKTVGTQTTILAKDASTQTIPGFFLCDLGNLAELSLKCQLMQQQNQKLEQEKRKLLSKTNSIAAATPRKPFNELSSRQARRREKQEMKLLQERSPSLLSPVPLRKLTPGEDLKITLEVGLSWKQRERLKSALDKRLVNCFCGTRAILKIKAEETKISAKELSDDGLTTLSYACEMVVKILHSFLGKTTPKAHWLLHCVIFAKEQRWLGLLSDQCLESLHSKFNLLMNRFKHTGDQMTALEGMLKHQLLWNFIHDEGLDEGQLLEEDQEEKENFSP